MPKMFGFLKSKDKKSTNGLSKPELQKGFSNPSLRSGSSSLKSPTFRMDNRASGSSGPPTPLTPFSPAPTRRITADLPKPPDPALDPAGYLRSLSAVRDRCSIIYEKALANKLNHFDVDFSKFNDVVQFVSKMIKVCRGKAKSNNTG